ncbi:MAG: type II toxin-antitoxin system VapC family toxin [Armatimonadetes bacterium]|nr:type II toxin-antitoxin system VapC family toxin [Armatimonadota bacterium]
MGHQNQIIVMNASVFLAAILLDEPKEVSEPALKMLTDIDSGRVEAHVPDRFEDEVLGGLVEAITKGRPVTLTALATFFHFWDKMTIHHRGVDWSAQEVFNASSRWRVSYYDAVYLLVAQKLGATYWTADKKLLKFLQRQKFADLPNLGWIGSYR